MREFTFLSIGAVYQEFLNQGYETNDALVELVPHVAHKDLQRHVRPRHGEQGTPGQEFAPFHRVVEGPSVIFVAGFGHHGTRPRPTGNGGSGRSVGGGGGGGRSERSVGGFFNPNIVFMLGFLCVPVH